jgi:methylated-DNA-[protein]-cysteine S-methyltransferase
VVVTWTRYAIPGWGLGQVASCAGRLVAHALPRPGEGRPRGYDPLVERIAAYFGGELVEFDDVRLHDPGRSAFERDVVAALRRIPFGETVTYGELAALAGHPGAQRAAGSVCARNRFGLVVPCHRVVAADGPGRYGTLGREYKLRLLRLERAAPPG